MSDTHATTHVIPFKVFFIVWGGLIALTFVTVGVTELALGKMSTFTAVLIASVKASLVLLYFMHLRFESRLIQIIALVTIVTLAIFVFLTFADYSFR